MNEHFRNKAISLMKENDIKELTFISNEGEWLIEDVPYVLCQVKEDILDLAVSKVILNDDDKLQIIVNDCDDVYRLNEYDPLYNSMEYVYLTIIEDIRKELKYDN